SRGDLISKIHEHGEVLSLEHTADGTRVSALVHAGLAGELAPYATARTR
ncbi:MAG: GTPase HflX, partial [Propionibacteriales bacterium]|nr:GTPase HflX [Propionibacteriales bacterium]